MTQLARALAQRDDLKARYLRDYLNVRPRKGNFKAFGMADVADYLPPDQRLAIGVAFGDADRPLGTALRVARRDGIAHRAAQEMAETLDKEGSWSDIRIVENPSVPARTEVDSIEETEGFPLGGDPLLLGVSVSHPKSPAGSLGGFVRFKGGGEGIISACHILANSGRSVDVTSDDTAPMVYHPASADVSGRLTPQNQIGRLRNFVTLDTSTVELDVAVAALMPHRTHNGNVIPKIPGAKSAGMRVLGPPEDEKTASFRMVAKIGRKTGYTEGRLSSGFYNEVPLEVPGIGIVYYSRVFEVESLTPAAPFAEPGDSGAAVFDTQSRAAFAMVVGGGMWDDNGKSRMLVYCCNLAVALKALKVNWL